jgi:hypothetical protein
MLSLTGVSRQILGWGTNVNRDILDEQISQLYEVQAQFCQDVANQILWPLCARQLALAEIPPMDIQVSFQWNQPRPMSITAKMVENARQDAMANLITRDEFRRLATSYYGTVLTEESISELLTPEAEADPIAENPVVSKGVFKFKGRRG